MCPFGLFEVVKDVEPFGLFEVVKDVEPKLELNSLQKYHAEVLGHLSGRGYPHHIKTQGEISQWYQEAHEEHKKRTLKWKASKTSDLHSKKQHHKTKKNVLHTLKQNNKQVKKEHTMSEQYRLRCQPMIQGYDGQPQTSVTNAYSVFPFGSAARFRTISANLTDTGVPTKYCFTTSEDQEPGSTVGLSQCYPTPGENNRDDMQQWIFGSDYTIRPLKAQNMCLTNTCYNPQDGKPNSVQLNTPLTLERCDNSAVQHWSYLGNGNGMHTGQSGTINFGSAVMSIAVCSTTKNQC